MVQKSTPKKNVLHLKKRRKEGEPSAQALDFLKLFARSCHIEKSIPAPLDKMCIN